MRTICVNACNLEVAIKVDGLITICKSTDNNGKVIYLTILPASEYKSILLMDGYKPILLGDWYKYFCDTFPNYGQVEKIAHGDVRNY